ncbi:hypothetical protein F4781DRAFT_397103 [Annulohypoxylon bovei var. microspora]|nr:hypothetical protein F4781DRAFT_397103 [Annulohypoxylon bovei var. microspora]
MNSRIVARPSMDDPEKAKNEVRQIYKKKLPNREMVAGALAPIFGLGSGMMPQQRASGLFIHPAFCDSFSEFKHSYIQGQWDLPIGDFGEVHKLVHRLAKDESWIEEKAPDSTGWTVNHFYARFILRTFHEIKENKLSLAYWLKETSVCEAIWVLTHALMYIQLETMRDYKKYAPIKDRINHFIETRKTDNTT